MTAAGMRTNIEIDDELMRRALKASGLKTKREVVDAALRQFVKQGDQRRALERLRGIGWEGDLAAWRRDKRRR